MTRRWPMLALVVAVTTACAASPETRAKVAVEESAKLPRSAKPLSSYRGFELAALTMSPGVQAGAGKAEMSEELERKLQARLSPLLAQWRSQGAAATGNETLVIRPKVVGLRVVSQGTRLLAGAFAGESFIELELELAEAASKSVIASPRIRRNADALAGGWSAGATDQNLLDYIADIAYQYLVDSYRR